MPERNADTLTPREREVLDLVRVGLTNEEIAERLGITLDGAKYHVSQILSKLGVATREDAAAAAAPKPPVRAPGRRRWWAALPLAAKAAGAALVVAAVAGLGVLAWGVLETSDETDDSGVSAAGSVCTPPKELGADFYGTGRQRFHVGWAGTKICWPDAEGEAEYILEGWIEYWPGCQALKAREPPRRVRISEVLPGDATDFVLPPTPDSRFPHAKDLIIDIRAVYASGTYVARGGFSATKELDYSTC